MAANKISKISLCGGEPFLFEGIIDLVAYAGKSDIRCSITTNGMTAYQLNENELNILKECETEINISIDSFDDTINSITRGSHSALTNALKSIRTLSKKNIPVTLLTVISKYNYQDLSKSFITAYENNIKQVLFQPVNYFSNFPERNALENKAQLNVNVDKLNVLMNELSKILQFEKEHNIKTNVYRILPWINYYIQTAENQSKKMFFDNVLHKFFCREIYAIVDISYNGGIQPCGLTDATVTIFENRQPGLLALWEMATVEIKDDLSKGKYYDCCNGCCHHFSRNMLASVFKHPFDNRLAIIKLMPLMLSRIQSGIFKKMTNKK